MADSKKVSSTTATLDRLKASGQLSALVRGKPAEKSAAVAAGAHEIELDKIAPDPDQPRRHFDKEKLVSLAESIKAQGVLQPITVQPANADGVHVIIMGERRFQASRLAGLSTVPVLVREVTPELRLAQLTENVQRADLTTFEVAQAVAAMRDAGKSRAEIGAALGWSESMVSRFTTIAQMPPEFTELAKVDVSPRALSDLFSLYKEHEAAVLDFIAETPAGNVNFTTVGQLRDRLLHPVADEPSAPDLAPGIAQEPDAPPMEPESAGGGGVESPAPAVPPVEPKTERVPASKGVVLICRVGDDVGRIDTTKVPETAGCLVVRFENGARIEDVPLESVTLIDVVPLD